MARADVVQALHRRWDRGEFLLAMARGQPVVPLVVPLRGPSARDVADRFGEVQDWVRTWEAQAAPGIRLEYDAVGGRLVGVNRVPARACLDDARQLWRLLGVQRQVESLTVLLGTVREQYPELEEWARAHPREVLAREAVLPRALAVVRWIADHSDRGVYLRQIDVPGVDTKFVEQHKTFLADLLDVVLPAERLQTHVPRTDFPGRYGLATRPAYVRLRRLDGAPVTLRGVATAGVSSGFSELTLRVDDLATGPAEARRVIVVENEITYLALPAVPDTLAVWGGGYAVAGLARLGWLSDRDLLYWGDLDTHGFAILGQLRSRFPAVRSLLMDRSTLETHEAHWGVEASPLNRELTQLTEAEQSLYRDLVEGAYRQGLRLEQERVRFGWVRAALRGLGEL
jgi:hypothetical protein